MLKETVIIDLDVEAKDELSEQVRGTIQSRNEHRERFIDEVLISYKQLAVSTTVNARKAPPTQQHLSISGLSLQRHYNKL
jgi:hypothetical protein